MELFVASGEAPIDPIWKFSRVLGGKRMKKSLIIFGLCAATALFAQGPRPGRGWAGGPQGMPGMGPGMARTITGAPYSAVEVRESTQTLPNGM